MGDLLLHARHRVPAHMQPNINQVAEANYHQKSLRLKEHLGTVQLADANDKPHSAVGAHIKDLDHAAYAVDINAAAIPNQLSGNIHNSPTQQPPPGQHVQHDVTSKNPSAEKQQQKVDNSKYVPMYDVYFIGEYRFYFFTKTVSYELKNDCMLHR